MKKILILAYDFPPYNSIGAQRPASWLKYLKQFGWQPIVVTRHWDADIKNEIDYIKPSKKLQIGVEESDLGTVVRAPFIPNLRDRVILNYGMDKMVIFRKLFTLFLQLFRFRLPRLDATYSIYKVAKDYLSNHQVDLIIATGEPFILFLYAQRLSKEFNTPWIADYRDCWSNNYEVKNKNFLEKLIASHYFRRIETKLVQSASLVATAAPSFQNDLKRLHPSKRIEVIFNGFDRLKNTMSNCGSSTRFEIVYIGTLYKYQPIEIFLEGFNQFCKSKEGIVDVNLTFYGLNFYPEQVRRIQNNIGSSNNFYFTERISKDKLYEKIRRAQLLLLLGSSKEERIPAKIFDYLQANQKILLVENDHGVLEQIIKECQAGVTADTPEEVAAILEKYYLEWQETGEVKHQTENYEQYSRERQTEKLAKLLDKYVV